MTEQAIVIFIAVVIPIGGMMQIIMFAQYGNDTENIEYYFSKKEQLRLNIISIIFNILGLIIIFWLLSIGGTFMWILIPLIIILFYNRYFIKFLVKKKYLKNEQMNNDIALIIITIITLTFCVGKFNALQIKENVEFDYIIENNKPKKYLGKAGDFFIVSNIDNSSKKFIESSKIVNFEINTFNSLLVRSQKDSLILKTIEKK